MGQFGLILIIVVVSLVVGLPFYMLKSWLAGKAQEKVVGAVSRAVNKEDNEIVDDAFANGIRLYYSSSITGDQAKDAVRYAASNYKLRIDEQSDTYWEMRTGLMGGAYVDVHFPKDTAGGDGLVVGFELTGSQSQPGFVDQNVLTITRVWSLVEERLKTLDANVRIERKPTSFKTSYW